MHSDVSWVLRRKERCWYLMSCRFYTVCVCVCACVRACVRACCCCFVCFCCCFDTITNTSFTSSLLCCVLFSRASFWCDYNVFGVTDRTPWSSQFCVLVTEEMHGDCPHFCHRLFLSLWCKHLITYCSVLEKIYVHEKWCGLLGFTPQSILNS